MNNKTLDQNEPRLQAPGAGLPFIELFVLKYWVGPFVSKSAKLNEIKTQYESINQKIINMVSKIDSDKRNQRVLVDHIQGIEDSSRFWSINGTLEHLMIVAKSISPVILELAQNKMPQGEAKIEMVKPKHHDQDALIEFQTYGANLLMDLAQKLLAPGMDINSALKFRHPWFGPITAKQWYWLLNTHQLIHYKQIKTIIKNL